MYFYKPIFIVILGVPVLPLIADECVAWNLTHSKRKDLKVAKIEIDARDIFNHSNRKENRVIHRIANKLHIKTRPSTISDQLLFKTGELFRLEKLEETERNLRKQRYLKGSNISPIEVCGNGVNILVRTRDNWTLTPGLTFSRSGGNNRSGIEIQEHNLLGLGKSISFKYKKNKDRNSKLFYYKDSQLFGTRKNLSINLQDNTDGKGHAVRLGLPFYELDSKRAWDVSTSKLKQVVPLYEQGKVINKITEEKQKHSVFYGWSQGQKKERLSRFKVGWTFSKTDYISASNNLLFKSSRVQESYPWLEYSLAKNHYITKINFKTMGKIEDVSLGDTATIGLGLLQKAFGSDDNHLKLSASYFKGFELGKSSLGSIKVIGESYLGKGKRQGETLILETEYDHFNEKGNDIRISATLKYSSNLKLSEQLVLGGETGLRGYPVAYQTGNKSLLIQAEKRIHFNWYPMHLVKFGAVVFSDIGTAWDDGENKKLLADVGVGLRMIPTRSSTGKALHFDLAFPLIDRGRLDKYQFLIRTANSF